MGIGIVKHAVLPDYRSPISQPMDRSPVRSKDLAIADSLPKLSVGRLVTAMQACAAASSSAFWIFVPSPFSA